jgi:hypothetical protein
MVYCVFLEKNGLRFDIDDLCWRGITMGVLSSKISRTVRRRDHQYRVEELEQPARRSKDVREKVRVEKVEQMELPTR